MILLNKFGSFTQNNPLIQWCIKEIYNTQSQNNCLVFCRFQYRRHFQYFPSDNGLFIEVVMDFRIMTHEKFSTSCGCNLEVIEWVATCFLSRVAVMVSGLEAPHNLRNFLNRSIYSIQIWEVHQTMFICLFGIFLPCRYAKNIRVFSSTPASKR